MTHQYLASTGHVIVVNARHGYVRISGDLDTATDVPEAEIRDACELHGLRCTWEPISPTEYLAIPHAIDAVVAVLAADHCASPEVVQAGGPDAADADDFDAHTLRDALRDAGLDDGIVNVRALRAALRSELAACAPADDDERYANIQAAGGWGYV